MVESGVSRVVRIALGLVVAVVATVALAALASSAAATKYVSSYVGNPGSTGGLLSSPRGVAVNHGSGALYIVDAGNNRIQQFAADGGFVRAWGADVDSGGGAGFEVCEVAASCQPGAEGLEGGMLSLVSGSRGGIAVNQSSGDVYVTDSNNLRVQQFTASGQFVRAWGQDVIVNTGAPANANGTGFEVCDTTTVPANSLSDCKAGIAGTSGGAFNTTANSAFDGYPATVPPGAPNAGNLLVADPANRRVQEFTSSGAFVRAFGADVHLPAGGVDLEVCAAIAQCKEGAPGGSAPGRFGEGGPKRVAADAAGAMYTTESSFVGGNFRVQKFTAQPAAPGLAASVFAPAVLSDLGDGRAPMELATAPVGDRVFVVKGVGPGASTCADGSQSVSSERRIFELDGSGALLDTHLACAGFTSFRSIYGLAVRDGELLFSSTYTGGSGATDRVYVADDDGITAALSSVDSISSVTSNSAQIDGTVNANSVDNDFGPTRWKLQLSSDGSSWSTIASGSVPAGTSDVPVSVSAADLLPNTGYQVRIVTQKPFENPEISSPEVSFATEAIPPGVSAVDADMVDRDSVRLTGQVNPHSTSSSYRFEWGQGNFDNAVPVPDGQIGSGSAFVFVSEQLSGLQSGTTYQFRLVATSETEGPTTSATQTFTTAAAPVESLAREFELVSPADKVGGTGVGRWYAGPGSMAASGVAAWSGERFAAMGLFGSVLRDDGGFSFANDWAFADRVDDEAGWRSHSPITHSSGRAQHASFLQIASSSEDLSSFFWRSNSMPFFFDGFEPVWQEFDGGYLGSWGTPPAAPARWELFGPDDLSNVDLVDARAVKRLWEVKLSADGSTAVGLVALGEGAPRLPLVHGLAGSGDPTARSFGDLVSGRSVYLADIAGGLTDTFAIGERILVNSCTGTAGADRTLLPMVDGLGNLASIECPVPDAGRDTRLISDHGASLRPLGDRPGGGSLAGTVSGDGSRVFFLAPDPAATGVPNGTGAFCAGSGENTLCPPQLFVRQRTSGGDVVRWISRAEAGLFGSQVATLTGGVRFEGATPDGDKVFFRTNSPLTADDPNGTGAPVPGGVTTGSASSSSWDLYVYDLPDDLDADPADGELTRISAGPGGDGDCNSPLPSIAAGSDNGAIGALRAASRDGRRVYFTCTAPLPGVGAPADGTRLTVPGGTPSTTDQTNLYLYDANLPAAERWRFVARLPRVLSAPTGTTGSVDACASAGTVPKSSFGSHNDDANTNFTRWQEANCVNATSDGAFVTFMTTGRLTLDDAPVPQTGDMYGYDAESDKLVRITAAQGSTGAAQPCVTVAAAPLCWGTGSPESMPEVDDGGRANTALGVATDPLVAGDRIAFFQSLSRLVPEDVDDGYDVYQWRNGDLSLVSTGSSDTDGALYKGNDRSGRNVYLVTQDKLTWQDTDAVADIYTARVGGGIAQPVPPVVCDALLDVCQPPGPAPRPLPPRSTQQPTGGNQVPQSERAVISLGGISPAERRRAARTGVLRLRVKTTKAGVIRVRARARIKGRPVTVASRSRRLAAAGTARIALRLSPAARRVLRGGRSLKLALRVDQSGSARRSATVRLPGVKS